MVESKDTALDEVFGALADPTRRAIVEQLRQGPARVGDLAEPHEITIQGVSKHLKKLEAAGLIRRRKEGREVWCDLQFQPMAEALSWIDEQRRMWNARLGRLEDLLNEKKRRRKNDGDQDQ